jgi:hypothetical protein
VFADGQVIKRVQDLIRIPEGEFWYLASPYTKYRDGLDAAAAIVSRVAGRLFQSDVPFFCPVAHTYAIAKFAKVDKLAHAKWMALDRPMMLAAYGIVIVRMHGWQDSKGIGEEEDYFVSASKPRVFIDPLFCDYAKEVA